MDKVHSLIAETTGSESNVLEIEKILKSNEYEAERILNIEKDQELRLKLISSGFCGKFVYDESLPDSEKIEIWWAALKVDSGLLKHSTKPCLDLEASLYADLNKAGLFTRKLIELSMEESEDDLLFHKVFQASIASQEFQLGLEYDIFEHTPNHLSDDYLERWSDLCQWSETTFNTERARRLKTIVQSQSFAAAREFINLREGGIRLKQRLRKNIKLLYSAEGNNKIASKKKDTCYTLADFKLKSDAIKTLNNLKMDSKYDSIIFDLKNNLENACYCQNDSVSNRLTTTGCCQQLMHPECKIKYHQFNNGCAFCRSFENQ